MLHFTIKGETYDWDYSLMWSEARVVQGLLGCTVKEWDQRVDDGEAEAVGALVYLAMRRAGSGIEWDDLDFDMREMAVSKDDPPVKPAVKRASRAKAPKAE